MRINKKYCRRQVGLLVKPVELPTLRAKSDGKLFVLVKVPQLPQNLRTTFILVNSPRNRSKAALLKHDDKEGP